MVKSKFVYDAEDATRLVITPAEPDLPASAASSLRHEWVREHRRALLNEAHVLPLVTLVSQLRDEGRGYVPDFDPLDGGVNARILFLMEKPGPKTDPRRGGSGFISRDNDDPTAAAVFTFMQNAKVDRDDAVIWNVVPWWDDTIHIRAAEWKHGLQHLEMLMEVLPRLQAVVLVGTKAGRAAPLFRSHGLPVWRSAHPSARVRAAYPAQYEAIQGVWAEAARHVSG